MVLTAAQTTAFFTTQMEIPVATYDQMQREGIQSVTDLEDFDEKAVTYLSDNLRKPPGRVPDPNNPG